MIKVGITGGMGSGKSIVCLIFEKLGIPVFAADSVAKDIMVSNLKVKNQLTEMFGNDIYQNNGAVHRKKLANIIFNNNIALQNINEIVHPIVHEEFRNWALKQTSKYVIMEAAILFENNHHGHFDKIITVTAPIELKIERCMKRDGISKDLVLERMKNQLPDEYKISKSDFVILNDDIEMVLPQVINIHKKLM